MTPFHVRTFDPAYWQRGGIIFRLLFLICFLAFLAALYLVRHPLLRLAGGFWVVDDRPQPSDVIVIVSDDNYQGDRAARAAELLKAGWAPRVVASGRYLRPYVSIADFMQRDLEARGVLESAIVRFPQRVSDTREEALELSPFLASRGWKKILLVTSNYHTRRAKYIYERTLAPGSELRVISARDYKYDPDSWWQHRQSAKIFFHEFVGYAVALWEMRHQPVQTSD